MARLLSFWNWIIRHFTTPPAAPDIPPTVGALAVQPVTEPIPELLPSDQVIAPNEALWHFRATILDRLGEYFACIRRLKAHDSDGYGLFSRVGFTVPSQLWRSDTDRHRSDLDTPRYIPSDMKRYTFGGILFGGARDHISVKQAADGFHPTFAYFQKMQLPSRVQILAGDIYHFVLIFDDRDRHHSWRATITYPVDCHINVARDGRISLLKEVVQNTRRITTKRKEHGRRDTFEVSASQWDFPKWTYGEPNEWFKTGKGWVEWLFDCTYRTHTAGTEKILIRARDNDALVATFGIDLPRAKVFFRDRDELDNLAVDGKRKRIFHAVTEHTRRLHTKHKSETTVRFHYRGVRDFLWNTYRIHIVLPDLTSMIKMTFAGTYTEDIPDGERYLRMPAVGKRLAAELDK